MSQLVIVRHGQASLLEENYDKLSPLGERQSQLLGAYWAAKNARVDEVVSGPCKRQLDTAAIVGDQFKNAGLPWPDVKVLDELNEYQAEQVLKQSVSVLAEKHEHIRDLRKAFHDSDGRPAAVRNFQKLFETVILMWGRGDFVCDGVEPWDAFGVRVGKALDKILDGETRGRTVAVFTSGGPIAVALQRALELTPQKTLQMSWMMRNAAYCEFLFSRDRFTLSGYNHYPHLNEPELLTYW